MAFKRMKCAAILTALISINSGSAKAEESIGEWLMDFSHSKGVKEVSNKFYLEECGSCHFAYQPGLLPAKSWRILLTNQGLHNHFGEAADLDKETLRVIFDYAIENAADKSLYKISRKITVATGDAETPLRITDVRYIKRKHHGIPAKMIQDNKEVKSLGNCNACHTEAGKGVFDRDTVSIPNFPDY